MALAQPTNSKRLRSGRLISSEEAEQFDSLLVDAYDKAWWRRFVHTIYDRRTMFLQSLVDGNLERADEDQLRGMIKELSFILALDERAEGLYKEKGNGG